MSDVNIVIGGEAGQGLVTIGQLMTKALVRSGYEVHVYQDYLSRIRGGHNTFQIRFAPTPVHAPREMVDVLVALAPETVEMFGNRLAKDAVIVADESIDVGQHNAFKAPLKDLAGNKTYVNTAALGVLASTICGDISILEELLTETFAKKGQEVIDKNIEVLRKAYKWQQDHDALFTCPAPPEGERRLTMNGNEAIALGAMAAGCNFLSFYPMTPSTSIALPIIAHSESMGIRVEQVEDEIAAFNMGLGAAYAGARSIVTTSGGGFALMTEAVSLGGMIETPIVLALAQRPGPATGLPTRTEQGDLLMTLFAGHGEFPRPIFTPGTVKECFYLTHKAFEFAEKYQTPVFILTDQYLADSYRAIEPFDVDSLPEIPGPVLEPKQGEAYERFSLDTANGVSPRAVPGFSKSLVVVDSDEHTPDGHITEDHGVRIAMNRKRLRKECAMIPEVTPPSFVGHDNPDLVLVCWGSTKGAAEEAAYLLNLNGHRVAVLHFKQVFPLNPEQFIHYLHGDRTIVAVEGNATAQFAKILRMETGFHIERKVLRFDGLPLTAQYIINGLEQVV